MQLDEFYKSDYLEHLRVGGDDGDRSAGDGFVRADYIHFSFLRLRLIRGERNCDKSSMLLSTVYKSVEAPPGDCLFQALINTFAHRKHRPMNLDIPELREICEIPSGGVSLDLMDEIEERLSWGAGLTKAG